MTRALPILFLVIEHLPFCLRQLLLKAIGDTREIGGQLLSDNVGDLVLSWIAVEIYERKHDDRQMCRSGWRVRRNGYISARVKEIPSSCRSEDQEEGGHPSS
jgi:hypothetical protein